MNLVSPDDPILSEVQPEFTGNVIELQDAALEMFNIMRDNNGIGIAAPQVGIRARMFVMALGRESFANCWVCINPKVLSAEGEWIEKREGCLTIPRQFYNVTRQTDLHVEYIDLYGQQQTRWISGLLGRCFLHELDHLEGRVIWDSQ